MDTRSDRRPQRVLGGLAEARLAILPAVLLAVLLTVLLAMPGSASAATDRVSPAPEDFVRLQYEDFLTRQPDPGGLAFWAARIDDGVDPATLINQMVAAPEFGETVAPLARLYEAYFLRTPDYMGLNFWSGRRRAGWSLSDVSTFFAASDEFQARYGDLSNAEFVELVYTNVLKRKPDPGGFAFWTARLDAGASRGSVMIGFSESPEYVAKTYGKVRATMLYLGMLRRTPDPGGLDFWAGRIDDGMNYGDVVRGFLHSAEYQGRLATLFPHTNPLTGQASATAKPRPLLALKIDDSPKARPQIGINQADVVFEEMVEGSSTRLIAMFHSRTPSAAGPVRSVRTTDFDILSPLNFPLLGASGANKLVLADLANEPIVNLNALVAHGYYRMSDRRSPHNLLVDPASLWQQAADRGAGATPPALFRYRSPGSSLHPTATPAGGGVVVNFGLTSVSYRWDHRGWVRAQDGREFIDSTGRVVAPDNVIVMVTPYGISPADPQSPEAVTVGAERAWVFTAGHRIDGWWTRDNDTQVIRFVDANGHDIELTPGITWVELAPPGSTTLG